MKSGFKSFSDLEVWQLAHEIKIEIYEFTKLLPASEKFNRVQQLQRSISSISANIAEGFGRYHYLENMRFCRLARGSLEESIDHLISAKDLNQAPAEKCEYLINKLIRLRMLLNGYIRFLNKFVK